MTQLISYNLALDITFSYRTIFRMFWNRIIRGRVTDIKIILPIIVDGQQKLIPMSRQLCMQLDGGLVTLRNIRTSQMSPTYKTITIEM